MPVTPPRAGHGVLPCIAASRKLVVQCDYKDDHSEFPMTGIILSRRSQSRQVLIVCGSGACASLQWKIVAAFATAETNKMRRLPGRLLFSLFFLI
jgi:hypothetical protein